MRDSEALQILGTQTPIDFPDVFETNTEYDYRANLMADNQNFSDFHEWFDGHQRYGGDDFTSVQRMPISGPFYPISDNFAISGYGDRSNVTVQPLAAENIIMVSFSCVLHRAALLIYPSYMMDNVPQRVACSLNS